MIYLKNSSETSAITIRYGVGSRQLIQVNPGCQIPKPFDLTPGEVQKYLSLFKNLSVVDIPEGEINENPTDETQPDSVQSTGEETNGSNGTDPSTNDEQKNGSTDEGHVCEGDSQNSEESGSTDESDDNEKSEESTDESDGTEESDESGESTEESDGTEESTDEGSSNGSDSESEKPIIYTENQLKKLDINLVRDVALKLNIMVNEDDRKKDLIAVILKRQEELKK